MEENFDSILSMYLFEENSLLEQLDEILMRAEKEQAFDKECVDEIFRIMHTIKGSSAMLQFNSITEVAHKIEDLFFYVRENGVEQKYNERLVDLVFKGTDFLKSEISKLEEGKELETDLDELEDEIANLLNIISGKVIETGDVKEIIEEVSQDSKYAIKVNFDDEIGMENIRALLLVNKLKESEIEFTYKPENLEGISETADEIIIEGFFIYAKNTESLKAVIRVLEDSINIKNYTVIEDEKEIVEIKKEEVVENKEIKIEDKKQDSAVKTNNKHSKQNLITVNLEKLDELVNIVGELVIAESMVTSDPDIKVLKSDRFMKSTREMRKLTDELQDIVMSLRMVPVSGVFQKMKRIVRDMGKELNKDVELVLIGEDTEIDKTIIDEISDPIMHLVRNAMDHGIETEEERAVSGKDKKGTIRLSASNTNGEIHITVEDDGKGFNVDKILAKAKKKNMLTKPESEYTNKEIYQFILMPGFSTNENVTEFSGRGVGMDVVKSNVEKIGGNVILDSKEGNGTIITFKIPLTLTIISGMQVVVGKSEFIIPIKNIRQSFITSKEEIITNTDGSEMIIIRDICYPVIRIQEKYNIKTDVKNIDNGIVILVEYGDKGVCLFVDKIIGEQQVVVKPIPPILNKYKLKESGISGCSILGDGNINLILDIGNLIESV